MTDTNPTYRTGSHKKMVIVSFLGNPMLKTDGNLVRIRNVLQFLVESDFNVTFYSFVGTSVWPWSANDEIDFRATFPKISLVRDRRNFRLSLLEHLKRKLTALAPTLTAKIVAVTVPGLTPEWSRLRAEYPDAVFLLNYARNATQLNGVDLSRACIETHDLGFRALALSRGHPIWHSYIVRYMRRELSILDAARVVLSISRTEHTVFETLLQSPKIYYLPPNIKSQNEPEPSKAKEIDLLFLGSGNYKNVRGINGFLKMYRTWKVKPTLAIAGNVSSHVQVQPDSDSSVSIMGHVECLPQLYESVRAVICPVEGTGVNIKIFEALAHGKPAFASRAAIAALPKGSEECVFPLTETCIREVLADPYKMHAASTAALKYVENPYIRDLWADFEQALRDLLNGV